MRQDQAVDYQTWPVLQEQALQIKGGLICQLRCSIRGHHSKPAIEREIKRMTFISIEYD